MSSEEIKALESTIQPRKPSRVRKFKEDYVNENTQLRIELHAVKCKYEQEVEDHNLSRDVLEFPTIKQAIFMLYRAVSMKVRGL